MYSLDYSSDGGFLPIGCGEGLKPIGLEGPTQALADHKIFIDYQDVRFVGHEELFLEFFCFRSYRWDKTTSTISNCRATE